MVNILGFFETILKSRTNHKENFSDDEFTEFIDNSKKTVPLLTCILLGVLFLAIVLKRFQSKGDKSESIPSISMIDVLFRIFYYRNDITKLLEEYANKFDAVKASFFGAKFVYINNPAMLQKLHASTNPEHLHKPDVVYSQIFPGQIGKGLIAAKVEDWIPHRKLLSKAFQYEALKSYVSVFNKHSKSLVSDLDEFLAVGDHKNNGKGENSEGVILFHLLHVACFEVISEITFGISFKAVLTQEELQKFHKNIHRIQQLVYYRFYRPWFQFDCLWKFHPYKKELETRVKDSERVNIDIMKKRMKDRCNKKPSGDFTETHAEINNVLDLMLQANWSIDEILAETATLLLAGHETVTTTLYFLLFLLAIETEHQVACRQEVDKLYESLENAGKEITIESLSQLKYLERCIKETLRMFPAVPMASRYLKAPLKLDDDTTLDVGTTVTCTIWSIHRNSKYFPNPGKFDPSRFLPENLKTQTNHSYIPFVGGKRNCIGWKMSQLELMVLAANILRHFNFSTKYNIEDIKLHLVVSTLPITHPGITFKRRIL